MGQSIIPLLTETLKDPFVFNVPQSLRATLAALNSVLLNAWPRIHCYSLQIIEAVVICWYRLSYETISSLSRAGEGMILETLSLLAAILAKDEDAKEEVRVVLRSDKRLDRLLIAWQE